MTFENVDDFLAKFKRNPKIVDYDAEAQKKMDEIAEQVRYLSSEVLHWAANLSSDEEAEDRVSSIAADLKKAAKELDEANGAA